MPSGPGWAVELPLPRTVIVQEPCGFGCVCEFFFAGLGFQSHVRDLILIPEPSEIRSRKAQFSLNASEP